MMQIGNVVIVKGDNRLLGIITAIDDRDRATVKLNNSGVEILVEISNLYCTGSTQPQRESGRIVHILGTEYKILIIEEGDYRYDKEADGWCDTQAKEILLFNFKQSIDSVKDLVSYQKKVLRYEIIHAFLYESGLWQDSYGSNCWAKNEEMVDWISIQEPKIHKAFKEAECDG
jgi:hypothetical protein